MGSSWSGFQPQNEIVKLQWVFLEVCQVEASAQDLGVFLAQQGDSDTVPWDEDDESCWTGAKCGPRGAKAK